ncbi:E3 ubiquitin-protein ligase RBBP6-like isoform X2 [Acanthochromis polyacanthus]|uniref:E3 ubiquitin-protein ligase RBBP6-like isoform X2 n=1 Tax=Acanthochromis polyacanthus TaxID=80966 RepID=UPI000B8FA446|nr:E3 ubiquitin-protein ligase RBBP6-like isoform X2 [Acanthochromis polyacanthus]
MPHIHYKFSSKLSYDTVVFDGPHVTLEELKRRIMGREKLRAADCDLQITNAQSNEEFTDDNSLIHKGSSVIVRRIPISGVKPSPSSKTHNIEQPDVQHHHAFGVSRAMDDQSSTGALSFFSKIQMANLVDADASEEDKIKFMIYQSAHDSMSVNTRLGPALPMNYTCYRCGNTGHHIRNCPTSGDKNFEAPLRIKKSTGIPRSFMVEVQDPTMKGAMLTKYGRYAIPAVDAEAYAIGKKEKPPFIPQEQPKSEDKDDPIPEELLCLICGDLLSDAVVIPCCGNSYCDDCIRTTLLDSEDHDCPTCGQSDVSPDTLVANRFLRQTINNFKRERSNTKTLKRKSDTSQTQNSTPTPTPVATPPPPVTKQNQLQKPQQSPNSQQDSLLQHPKATDSPPSSQASGPPTLTGPESAHSTPISSLQPVQNSLETSDKETEGNPLNESVAASSVLVSNKDPTDAPSEPTPPVNHTVVAEQPQTVSVNQQPSPADRASRPSGSSNSWDSSSSSSGYPSSLSSSSPYPATPPPLFPSPLFHTFLLAHQSHGSYPPGYPPAAPVWTLPTPQGAPIPPLCSSASTSSIPALIPKEWYRYQRKKKERSPHRGSSYRRPSSHSNSKSSKSKSSRSYSRSSSGSGSRSRSRSQSKSSPRSPYSHQRNRRTRSPPSCSYTFGYKRSRSPTPSSSSSPQVAYHSRSKSPSDHWKNRHHSKKSASSSYSSRRRGERSERETGGSGSSLTRNLYGQHTNQTSSQDLDRENYMQWKYKEWYEKYFSSYVGQFPQMPLPFINLLPPPCPQLEDREESKNHSHANLDSRYRPQGKHAARVDGRSTSSESSSDSRSPPSQSSSGSLSTPSHSSSSSRSSLSHKATDSHSPPSRSSSNGRSTPSEDGAQSCTGKHKSPTITPTRNSEKVDLQERSTDDKQPMLKKLEHFSTLKHEHKRMKKVDKARGEDSSSLDSTDDSRKGQSRKSSGPSSCKDGTPVKSKDKDDSESPPLKLNKPLDKDYERKVKGEKNMEREKGSRRGRDSDSRHKEERQPRKREPDRVNADKEETSRGSRAPDSRSEKNRKRKVENLERNEKESSLSVKTESSKCLKTEAAENLETCKRESLKSLDREEKKKEKKTWPLTEGDIWEGGMEVKPQRKISININLGGKRQEENTDKRDCSYSESITGESQENREHTAITEKEKLNKDKIETDVNEKKEPSKGQEILSEVKIKPEEEDRRKTWDKAAFVLEKAAVKKEDSGEKKDKTKEEDFDLWHCALRGVDESVIGRGEEVERVRDDCREEEMGGLAITPLKEKTEKESRCKENRGEEDYTARFNSQRSKRKSHHDGSKCTPDDSSRSSVVGSCGGEDRQERWTVVTTVEENTQDRAADVFIQVPRSKWGNNSKKEQNEGEIRVHAVSPVALPQPSVTNKETGGDKEQQRRRSMERGRDGEMVRGKDREKQENATSSWWHRSVAPSSGKNTTDSTSCSERERQRDRERVRERSNKSKRSKEEAKKEEKRRDGERERDRSSSASKQRRNPPSSSHSTSMSQHKEKRDSRRESNQGSDNGKFSTGRNSTTSRTTDLPDHSAHRPSRDVESKSKDHFHYGSYQERSGNSRHQDRSAGTHPSPPPSSLSHSKERDLLLFESSAGPKRRSPNGGVMQNKSRNDSEVEGGEWKPSTVDKIMKKGKGERANQEMVAGGSWWEDEDDKLEEEERPSSQSSSSSSSSTSQSSKDDQRNERKKERKHEKGKRQDLMEEGDLMQEKQRGGGH